MKKRTKNIISFALVALVSCFMVAGVVNAEADFSNIINVDEVATNSGLSNTTPQEALTNIIRLILALLGAVALVIILMGGFKWMTSGGDSGKIDAAKKLMGAGIVGLIIVIAAFIIQSFVVSAITGVTNSNTL